jgi:hypothetical protein
VRCSHAKSINFRTIYRREQLVIFDLPGKDVHLNATPPKTGAAIKRPDGQRSGELLRHQERLPALA